MTLSCGCDFYDGDDFWEPRKPFEFVEFSNRRRARCLSCRQLIEIGADCVVLDRRRFPRDDIEEAIHGEYVELAPWYLCETCGGLLMALDELGFCCELGDDSLAEQIKQYNRDAGVATLGEIHAR